MADAEVAQAFAYKPLYLQVKDSLVRRLIDGVWRPGQLIPSEMVWRARLGSVRGRCARRSTP